MDTAEFRQRIGPALVAEGFLTAEQLQIALKQQEKFPFFTIGQIVAILFRVPVENIDEVNVRKVVLPQLSSTFMARLVKIAQEDRFTKNFDVKAFISDIKTRVLSFEVINVVARTYEEDASDYRSTGYKSSIQTKVKVRILVTTRTGETVSSLVSVLHDSRERGVLVEEGDEFLKGSVYFELRKVYMESLRQHGDRAH